MNCTTETVLTSEFVDKTLARSHFNKDLCIKLWYHLLR